MNEEQIIKLIADLGPGGVDVAKMYIELLRDKMYINTSATVGTILSLPIVIYLTILFDRYISE